MWYIYTAEYYSVVKKNDIMPFVATWMDLDLLVLILLTNTLSFTQFVMVGWDLTKITFPLLYDFLLGSANRRC